MRQLNVADPCAPVVSVAVTVTLNVPVLVGVPEIRPVEELIDNPAGSPVAL
jgi:predicted transcriptional regulator